MRYAIEKLTNRYLKTAQEMAKRVIRHNYRLFFTEEVLEGYINSGNVDNEFVKNFENCHLLFFDDQIIGFTIFFDDFIHLLMIDHASQGKGHGRFLLRFAESALIKNGHRELKLETFKENQPAVRFYQKNGWSVVDSKIEEGLGVTRVFLRKKARQG